MKPIRQQFVDALGCERKTVAHFRDFTLTVVAGISILFGEIFGMAAHSGGSAFDLKLEVGCFALAGLCVSLAANRLFVLGCAIMVPAALIFWHFVVTGDRKAGAFYLMHMGAGMAVLAFGALAKFLWEGLRVRRTR
ncbi:MAG TPA: hypothetical protein VJP02_22365 [Candidatus Sulfotelmatobacter sp.]|nr:hypothetical protein [Candidatus Sulfotelmatobacter sp.]